MKIVSTFHVFVDETKTVEQLLENYHFLLTCDVCSNNFPLLACGKVEEREVVLVDFGDSLSTEQALIMIHEGGYRPATVHEVLALSNAHPNLQRQSAIAALGSVCVQDGRYVVPVLSADYPNRFRLVYLCDVSDDWPSSYHYPFYFACVCK